MDQLTPVSSNGRAVSIGSPSLRQAARIAGNAIVYEGARRVANNAIDTAGDIIMEVRNDYNHGTPMAPFQMGALDLSPAPTRIRSRIAMRYTGDSNHHGELIDFMWIKHPSRK